jgi:Major Facilitator Superfamily
VLAPLLVPEPPRREGHLDLRGGLLSATGLALLIYGFIRIGEGGSSVEVIAGLLAAAAALLSLLVVVEAHNATPLMPLRLILNRTRGLLYLVMLSISAVVTGMFFFISQYAQAALHYTALRAGLAFLPLTAAVFALSRVMPRVLARTGPRLPLLCGAALIAISLAWLSRTTAAQGYPGGLFGPLLLFGIGIGLSYVPMGATILKGVDRDDTGSASGMYQAMQQTGGSAGLAILVSIAAGHGQSAALEGAAGFAVLAFVLTAAAPSGQAAHY